MNNPLFGSGNSFGLYRQQIDATQFDEGRHYLTVIVFRHRDPVTSPMFREIRKVLYIDRLPPEVELVEAGQVLEDVSPTLTVRALDRTTTALHMFVDLEDGVDPLTLIGSANQASPYDRFEYRYSFGTLTPGSHEVTMVAIEDSGNSNVITETIFIGSPDCDADINNDGSA